MPVDHQTFWMRRARGVAWRHAVARYLDIFFPAALAACGAGALALLVVRSLGAEQQPVWIGLSVALLLAVGFAFVKAGRRLSLAQALVRLEERGQLHNRLSAAREGVGAWPLPVVVEDGVRWDWRRLVAAPVIAAAMLSAGRWAPLPPAAMAGPRQEPMAWSQVQSWLDQLEEAKLAEPEALEKIAGRLEELRQEPPGKWYEQSSLEAGDSLRQQTAAALRALQHDLQTAERIAAATSRAGAQPEQLKKLDEQWREALAGLQGGDLPLNKELLEQAKQFQPGAERQLSPEQMAELRERLAEGGKVCEQCVGARAPGPNDRPATEDGGEGGGGESAPLSWKKQPVPLEGKQKEKLENDDLTRALPAETLAVTSAEHEVKRDAAAGAAGGEIAGLGQGGAPVWREATVPREREVLRRFFK